MIEQKNNLLQFLTMQLKQIKKEVKQLESLSKPFRAFCYNDPLNGRFSIAQIQFEKALKRPNNYSMILGKNQTDSFGVNLEGKSDEKTLIEALDIVLKDKEYLKKLSNTLLNLKLAVKKSFNVPNNGQIFVSLFNRLFRESYNCNKSKNSQETSYNRAIQDLELLIPQKFRDIYTDINDYKKAIDIINEMILLISEDKIMDFSDEKRSIIFEQLPLSDDDKINYSFIEDYNVALQAQEIEKSGQSVAVDSEEYILALKEIIEEVEKKINGYDSFLKDIEELIGSNDFDDPSLVCEVEKVLISAKGDKTKKALLEKTLRKMFGDNPAYPQFISVISRTLGYKMPVTKKVIVLPTNFDEVLNIFEQYGLAYNNKQLFNKNSYENITEALHNVAIEILNVAKRTLVNKEKFSLSHSDLCKIVDGLENKTIINLSDERNLRETNLGFTSLDIPEARGFLAELLEEVNEFNKKIENNIKQKSKSAAKRLRTSVIKKLKEKGLEEASKYLETKISSIEDNLTLEVLDYLLELEYESAFLSDKTTIEQYHDLCCLSLDCTNYIRAKGIYQDNDEVRDFVSIDDVYKGR